MKARDMLRRFARFIAGDGIFFLWASASFVVVTLAGYHIELILIGGFGMAGSLALGLNMKRRRAEVSGQSAPAPEVRAVAGACGQLVYRHAVCQGVCGGVRGHKGGCVALSIEGATFDDGTRPPASHRGEGKPSTSGGDA